MTSWYLCVSIYRASHVLVFFTVKVLPVILFLWIEFELELEVCVWVVTVLLYGSLTFVFWVIDKNGYFNSI